MFATEPAEEAPPAAKESAFVTADGGPVPVYAGARERATGVMAAAAPQRLRYVTFGPYGSINECERRPQRARGGARPAAGGPAWS